MSGTYDATNDYWIDDKQPLIEQHQEAYASFFDKPAPQVRQSGKGGYYVKGSVMKHYEASDLRKVIRFFRRGGKVNERCCREGEASDRRFRLFRYA